MPRVTEVEISELGFDLGSIWFCPLYGVASIGHALCFSLLLCVSPGGLRAWASHLGVITLGRDKGAGSDWFLGITVHVTGGRVRDRLRWRRAKSLEKSLGVSIERDGWDRRDVPPFFSTKRLHLPHPEFSFNYGVE